MASSRLSRLAQLVFPAVLVLEQYGPWALVTGASSGIGAEFARRLAEEGFNLVLVARREKLLDAAAVALRNANEIEVRTIGADLSREHAASEVADAVADIEIGLLVANAGFGQLGPFLDLDLETERQVLLLNALSPMLLAHGLGRPMAVRGRGGIILTASIMGYMSVPYMATYAASKAYLIAFGEALRFELARHGVDVCVLSPGPTHTPLIEAGGIDLAKFPIKAMTVGPVVEAALRSLPSQSSAIPGFMNKLMVWMSKRILSRSRASSMFGKIMGKMAAAREARA